MAKKKKIAEVKSDDVSTLLELAEELHLPDGAFEEEIQDQADSGAKIIAENVMSESLMGQLEYLIQHGYGISRLAELIREYSRRKR